MYSDSSSATSDGDSSEEEDQVSRARKWASFCCGQHDHCYYLRHALRVDLSPLRECIASAHKPPEFAVIPVREEHSVRDVLHFMEHYITNYARSLLEHPHLRVLGVCHAYARKRKVLSPDAGVQELGCFSLFTAASTGTPCWPWWTWTCLSHLCWALCHGLGSGALCAACMRIV